MALSLGSLAVVGVILLLGILAWRSKSGLVGMAYTLAGAFFMFLPVILWRYAAQINDAPPLLPPPAADVVSQIYTWSAGPLNAIETIGAGMFLIGLLVVGQVERDRRAGPPIESH